MKDQDDRRSGLGHSNEMCGTGFQNCGTGFQPVEVTGCKPGPHGTKRAACAFAALTFLLGGCSIGKDFRAAAGPAVETGVNAILDGLVDGLFAAIEPEGTDGSDNASGN